MLSRVNVSLIVSGCAVCFTSMPLFAQSKAIPEYQLNAIGEIEVGADGAVLDYQLRNQLAPKVAELIDRDVRSWRFEPILINGVAVPAKARMELTLRAVPHDDNFALKIEKIVFGEPAHQGKMMPPHYPKSAVVAHLGARVLLYLRLDEQGNVAEIQPYQTSLDARASSDEEAERWRKLFEQASAAAAKTWKFGLNEVLDGKPIGSTVIVPIDFKVNGVGFDKRDPDAWRAYVPGPIHPASWVIDKRVADLGSLQDGSVQPIDSRFRLKNEVVGTTL